MEKLFIDTDRCKNCLYCVKNCPKQALRVDIHQVNKLGYQPTMVDHEKCIKCGICYLVCPDYVYEIREVGADE